MLESLKKTIQLFFAGKRKIESQQLGRIKNLSDASSIGLFFCIKSKGELVNIRNLLKKVRASGKQVTVYVFFQGYQSLDVVTDKSLFFFNLNDFTLFAKMKDILKQQIQESSFDLLISFVQSPDALCHLVSTKINAKFKVGAHQSDLSTVFDFTLETDLKDVGIEQFYQQVQDYLRVLNIERK